MGLQRYSCAVQGVTEIHERSVMLIEVCHADRERKINTTVRNDREAVTFAVSVMF